MSADIRIPERVETVRTEAAPERAAAPPRVPLVLFEHVSKWYGPVLGVNQVTLELHGGITGLVGANGAGKSTLLRLATGQLRPDVGRVSIGGCNAWHWRAKRIVGFCPDNDVFYEDMSGAQFVETIARMSGFSSGDARQRTAAMLDTVGMTPSAGRTIRGCSKGMRQRIKLAAALIHDPRLLVLDEPLAGVDPIGRRDLLELFLRLAEQGRCVLVSSHELDELEKLTDQVAIMARGRIAAVGTLARIRDLLDLHPISVRIECDRPRDLAQWLLQLDDVVAVEIGDGSAIVVRARNPRKFFRAVTRLVLENDVAVERLEPLDDSAHAVLGYLLNGGAS